MVGTTEAVITVGDKQRTSRNFFTRSKEESSSPGGVKKVQSTSSEDGSQSTAALTSMEDSCSDDFLNEDGSSRTNHSKGRVSRNREAEEGRSGNSNADLTHKSRTTSDGDLPLTSEDELGHIIASSDDIQTKTTSEPTPAPAPASTSSLPAYIQSDKSRNHANDKRIKYPKNRRKNHGQRDAISRSIENQLSAQFDGFRKEQLAQLSPKNIRSLIGKSSEIRKEKKKRQAERMRKKEERRKQEKENRKKQSSIKPFDEISVASPSNKESVSDDINRAKSKGLRGNSLEHKQVNGPTSPIAPRRLEPLSSKPQSYASKDAEVLERLNKIRKQKVTTLGPGQKLGLVPQTKQDVSISRLEKKLSDIQQQLESNQTELKSKQSQIQTLEEQLKQEGDASKMHQEHVRELVTMLRKRLSLHGGFNANPEDTENDSPVGPMAPFALNLELVHLVRRLEELYKAKLEKAEFELAESKEQISKSKSIHMEENDKMKKESSSTLAALKQQLQAADQKIEDLGRQIRARDLAQSLIDQVGDVELTTQKRNCLADRKATKYRAIMAEVSSQHKVEGLSSKTFDPVQPKASVLKKPIVSLLDVETSTKQGCRRRKLVPPVLASEAEGNKSDEMVHPENDSSVEMYNAILVELEMKEEELLSLTKSHRVEVEKLRQKIKEGDGQNSESSSLGAHQKVVDRLERKVTYLKGKLARSRQREEELLQELDFDHEIIQNLREASAKNTRSRKSFFF